MGAPRAPTGGFSARRGTIGAMSSRVPVSRPKTGRMGWVRPMSVRLVVLGIVALGAFALVIPTMMNYVEQRAETRQLEEQAAQTRAENDKLQTEIDRWNDDNYVAAQARERLSFGYDGETRYKVIDPQAVVDDTNPKTGQEVTAGAVEFPIGKEESWYRTLWESVEVAGGTAQ